MAKRNASVSDPFADSDDLTARKQRSRVSNGAAFGRDVDGRSARARRIKDLIAELTDALAPSDRSLARLMLVRRCASVIVAAELIEADLARGEDADVDALCRLSGLAGRLLSKLGLADVIAGPKPVDVRQAPAGDDELQTYLKSTYGAGRPDPADIARRRLPASDDDDTDFDARASERRARRAPIRRRVIERRHLDAAE
jgi:hypothetical protein